MESRLQLDNLPGIYMDTDIGWHQDIYADSLASCQLSVGSADAGMIPTSGAMMNTFQ